MRGTRCEDRIFRRCGGAGVRGYEVSFAGGNYFSRACLFSYLVPRTSYLEKTSHLESILAPPYPRTPENNNISNKEKTEKVHNRVGSAVHLKVF